MSTASSNWSSVLQNIIKLPSERQRLATELGVTAMTLTRWASGESNPQRPHLMRLVQAIHPRNRQDLVDALKEQYPDINTWLRDDNLELISSDFFSQVLSMRTTTTEGLLFWRISDMVLKQALAQLDPNRLGMSVKLIQCMPPRPEDGKIRSLHERAGRGTPPWTADLEHDVYFLGLESMSGYATEMRHIVNNDDLSKDSTIPSIKEEFEASAAAHPVRFEGSIAGCLLASSNQAGYFTQQRLSLLITFSDIIALAFDKKDFYPASLIELRVMPSAARQQPVLKTFRQRVTKNFQEAAARRTPLTRNEAEQRAWQEIEGELLALPDDGSSLYRN